jgi:hypothetical protein
MIMLLGLVATTAPYLYAHQAGGATHVFGGFLLNPVDGNSYLAKMTQGWRGDWTFRLPFTSDPGEGVYLFLFYLALGHLARILGLSLILTFHIARLVCSALMVFALYRFFGHHLGPDRGPVVPGLALAAFGAGLGWLALPFGSFTSDFWVAEAYPFLSMYANPHFPLGIALLVLLVLPSPSGIPSFSRGWNGLLFTTLALTLALALPFGVALALVILGLGALWKRDVRSWAIPRMALILLGGGPVYLYVYWVVRSHPALQIWNAQNQTPSPPPLDLLISFSPALIFVFLAVAKWIREKGIRVPFQTLVWPGAVLGLIYLPFNLQRRLLMGFYVPIACLGVYGLWKGLRDFPVRWRWAFWGVFALSIPTNLIILTAAFQGIQTLDPILYLTQGEARAFAWIRENTPPDSLILASPETGLFIPAHTGRRVVYGHPFETIRADHELELVEGYFAGDMNGDEKLNLIIERGVDYVFWGPREQTLAGPHSPDLSPVVFEEGDVNIFDVRAISMEDGGSIGTTITSIDPSTR